MATFFESWLCAELLFWIISEFSHSRYEVYHLHFMGKDPAAQTREGSLLKPMQLEGGEARIPCNGLLWPPLSSL